MEPSVAIRLIEAGITKSKSAHWADLGAGRGVFTNALATLLGSENTVFAVDQNEAALKSFETHADQATIVKMKMDFSKDMLNLPMLDGILMANSLHYIQAKDVFALNLRKMLKKDGRLLIIEYDTMTPNQWVPYPINFSSLNELMMSVGFSSVKKLGEQASQLRQGNIYSALIL